MTNDKNNYPPPSIIEDWLHACSVEPDIIPTAISSLTRLADLLYSNNQRYNLTRLTTPSDFWYKHVIDSLIMVHAFPELAKRPLRLADIGCGAGFPLLPLACCFPHWQLTGLEATGKKVAFIEKAIDQLSLGNVKVIHKQAREAARTEGLAGQFDLLTARAVASAGKLLRESRQLLPRSASSASCLVLYKTPAWADQEAAELTRECGKFGFSWSQSSLYSLPGEAGERLLVVIQPK